MAAIFHDARIVDVILLLMLIEAAAVLTWRRARGRGPALLPYLSNLLAGFFLILALRAALDGGGPTAMAISLAGALLAHLTDLGLRWRGDGTNSTSAPLSPSAVPRPENTDEATHG